MGAGGRGNGEGLLNRYRVYLWGDEKRASFTQYWEYTKDH